MKFILRIILLTLLIAIPITYLVNGMVEIDNIFNQLEVALFFIVVIGYSLYNYSDNNITKLDFYQDRITLVGLILLSLLIGIHVIFKILSYGYNTETGFFMTTAAALLIYIIVILYFSFNSLSEIM